MQVLRQLIREVVHDSSEEDASEYFGISQDSLNDLSKELFEMFSREGAWLFAPNDPEVVRLRKKFGVPVEYVADGSYRITFSIGNDLVLKISKDMQGNVSEGEPEAGQMNQDDWTLGNDPSIMNIVPRAYKHATDWSWVLLERVEPLSREEDFFQNFRSDFLPGPDELSDADRADYLTLIHMLLEMKNYKLDRPLEMRDTLKSYFLGSGIVKKSPDPDIPLLEIRRNLMRMSTAFKGLVLALKRYNIRISEINSDNLGVGADGRLVLLDSSIFPDV